MKTKKAEVCEARDSRPLRSGGQSEMPYHMKKPLVLSGFSGGGKAAKFELFEIHKRAD